VIRILAKWISFPAFLVLSGLAGLYLYVSAFEGHRAEKFEIFASQDSRPLVIAHRGGAGIAPENTLEAFQRSHDIGADILELDIRVTSDGKIVVIHDSTVDRTTNGTGKVAELTLSEIKQFDAGFHWNRKGGKAFPFRGKGIRVPTLREVFEAFPDTKINIEAKVETPGGVEQVCDLIHEFKRTSRSVVASAIGPVIDDFRANCKGVATSASASESTNFLAMYKIGLSKKFEANMQALQIPRYLFGIEVVSKEFVRAAREHNLELHVWTINKKEDMKRLIDLGADGIITDRPDRLLGLLREVGKPPDR
jgi:glycerophosphoryl diester phosphodiesterase